MTLLTLMVQINYAFIFLCVYISFLSASALSEPYLSTSIIWVDLDIFSLPPPSPLRTNIISICYQMGVLVVSFKKKKSPNTSQAIWCLGGV